MVKQLNSALIFLRRCLIGLARIHEPNVDQSGDDVLCRLTLGRSRCSTCVAMRAGVLDCRGKKELHRCVLRPA